MVPLAARSYPRTASALAAAVGYGTWSAAWLCDEASGSLQPVFGSPALAANGTPLYGITGPLGGDDKAVSWDSAGDRFFGTVTAPAANDLAFVWVAKFPSALADGDLLTLSDGSTRTGVYVSGTGLNFRARDAALNNVQKILTVSGDVDAWHVGVAAIDRAAGTANVAIRRLAGVSNSSASVSASSLGSLTDTTLALGSGATGAWVGASVNGMSLAFLGYARGAGAAAGLVTNIATACQNFSRSIGGA